MHPHLEFKRKPQRGTHDKDIILDILKKNNVCHIGFIKEGQVFVRPISYAISNDKLVVHGSQKNEMLNQSTNQIVSISVASNDGVTTGAKAINFSMKYSSVMILAKGEDITDMKEKEEALKAMTLQYSDKLWEELRGSDSHYKATKVVSFDLSQSSAKMKLE